MESTRCHSKRSCPCKKQNVLCTKLCHPAHSCVNMHTCSAKSPTIDLMMESEDFEFMQKSTEQTLPTQAQRNILCSYMWLDDTLVNLGQDMLRQQYEWPAVSAAG